MSGSTKGERGSSEKSSRKSTLSRNQFVISVLRKRSFVRHSRLRLKNQDFLVA